MSHKPKILFPNCDKLDRFLFKICKILIWRNPLITLFCIVIVNIIYWLICFSDFKFYGIFFTSVLIMTLKSFWSDVLSSIIFKKFKSSSCYIESNVEMSHLETQENIGLRNAIKKSRALIKNSIKQAVWLRQINPAGFCSLICTCFLLLSITAEFMSGITWIYAFLMLMLTLPGVSLHFLRLNWSGNFHLVKNKGSTNDTDLIVSSENDGIDPFLPEITPEVLELLSLASEVKSVDDSDFEDSTDFFLNCIEGQAFGIGTNCINKYFDKNSSDEKLPSKIKLQKVKKTKKKIARNGSKVHKIHVDINTKNYKNKTLISDQENLEKFASQREDTSDTDSFEIISDM